MLGTGVWSSGKAESVLHLLKCLFSPLKINLPSFLPSFHSCRFRCACGSRRQLAGVGNLLLCGFQAWEFACHAFSSKHHHPQAISPDLTVLAPSPKSFPSCLALWIPRIETPLCLMTSSGLFLCQLFASPHLQPVLSSSPIWTSPKLAT